jgi:S-DNA-T family DNA segregation ATPase FtsK/SpoIIIE
VDHALLVDRVLGLLREGAAQGLTAALSGDRSLLVGRVGSIVSHRVLLRLADRTDAALAGISPTAMPIDPPPGRGVLADGTQVQLALCPGGPFLTVPIPGEALPARVDPLPVRVTLDDLDLPRDTSMVALGVGGDELATVGLRPASDGRRWLAAGASGSGVSTTLLLLARQLMAQHYPVAVISQRAGPLDSLRGDGRLRAWCDTDSRTILDQARRRCPGLAVLVDRIDELVDSPIEAALRDFARTVDHHGGLLAVGANSSILATQYRGLGTDVARERSGVLLGPRAPSDADPFGLRLRPDPHAPPGRGYLVRHGVPVPVQVAFPGVPDTW